MFTNVKTLNDVPPGCIYAIAPEHDDFVDTGSEDIVVSDDDDARKLLKEIYRGD